VKRGKKKKKGGVTETAKKRKKFRRVELQDISQEKKKNGEEAGNE